MLNQRLRAIASLIETCDKLVDIGSDHGYLPLQLIKDGRIASAVLSELREKPLAQAKKNFKAEGLSERAEFYLSDGLRSIESKVEHVVIAGMGFETIIQIIEQDLERFRQCHQIIIQSNTKIEKVRSYMQAEKFCLLDEVFVIDRNHSYVALKYRYTGSIQALTETELFYGPILTAAITDDYRCYLQAKHLKYKNLHHLQKADILKKEQILADLFGNL